MNVKSVCLATLVTALVGIGAVRGQYPASSMGGEGTRALSSDGSADQAGTGSGPGDQGPAGHGPRADSRGRTAEERGESLAGVPAQVAGGHARRLVNQEFERTNYE